jgi:ABC-type transporter Mla subunit MlaD
MADDVTDEQIDELANQLESLVDRLSKRIRLLEAELDQKISDLEHLVERAQQKADEVERSLKRGY